MDEPFVMPVFSGEDLHSLDEKGRVAIPARIRSFAETEDGREVWYATRGFEKCLLLFTGETWKHLLQDKLSGLSLGNKQHRAFIRNFISPAVMIQADKQGRVLLPQRLREYAGITDEVLVLGANKYIELWNPGLFEQEQAASRMDGPEIGAKLEELGF